MEQYTGGLPTHTGLAEGYPPLEKLFIPTPEKMESMKEVSDFQDYLDSWLAGIVDKTGTEYQAGLELKKKLEQRLVGLGVGESNPLADLAGEPEAKGGRL